MTQTDLAAVLARAPRNCWLALNEDETAVVGRGETLEEAEDEARKNHVEDPIVVWAQKLGVQSSTEEPSS